MQRQFFKCERATEAGWYGERSSRTIDMEWFTTNQKFQVFHFLLLLSSRSVMSSSLRPQELQHTRLLCSSLSSGVCPNSCPLNQSYRLILCCPLLLPLVFPSIRVFYHELALYIRWPKYWSFRFSICFSNEYSAVISFWTDWFDLLAVHRALKNFLQHPNSKPSVLQCSAFFMSSSHIHAWLLKKP